MPRKTLILAALLLATTPHGATAATLFGLVNTGELFTSTDGGANWAAVSTLPVRDAVGLQARALATDLYLASRTGSVYHSTDGGDSWTAVGAATVSDVADLLVRQDGAILLLSETGSVLLSIDLGTTFTGLAALTASDFASLCQRADGNLYAITRTGSVYESVDDGASWTAIAAITASDLVKVRAVANVLYALSDAGFIYRSLDAGANWTAIGTLSQVGMRGLVNDGSDLVVASREGHVWSSADGVAWTVQGSMQQLTLTALASDDPAVTAVGGPSPASLALGNPWPNPARSTGLSLSVRLDRDDHVDVALHDLAGREVARRARESLPAGSHVLSWNPGPRAAGLYLVRVELGSGASATRRWVTLE